MRGGARASAARLVRSTPAPRPPSPCELALHRAGHARQPRACVRRRRRAPGPGEVEIRVHATGLNFKDVLNVLGMYPGDPGPLGGECAGVVVAVGAGVDGLRRRRRRRRRRAGQLPHPRHLRGRPRRPEAAGAERSPTAAGLLIANVTAEFALRHVGGSGGRRAGADPRRRRRRRPGRRRARRSGVGAEVYATAGSDAQARLPRVAGRRATCTTRARWPSPTQIMADTGGEGVDVVLNSLAGDFVGRQPRRAAPGRPLPRDRQDATTSTHETAADSAAASPTT